LVSRVRTWLRNRRAELAGGVAIALVSFPVGLTDIYRGLDPSYNAAMHILANSDAVFGRDVVFLYGPLGYLAFPQFYFGRTALLAIAASVALDIAIAYRVIQLVRRVAPVAVGIAAAFALVVLGIGAGAIPAAGNSSFPEAAFVLIVLWALDWIVTPTVSRVPVAGIVSISAFAAAMGLVKAELAVTCLCVVVVGIAVRAYGVGGRRQAALDVGLAAGTTVVTVLLLWVLVGQPIGALPDYLRGSYEIVSGFSNAMGQPGRDGDVAAAAIVSVVLLGAVVTSPGVSTRRRVVTTGAVTGLLFLAFKEGFARQDFLHTYRFFVLAATIAIVFVPLWGARSGLLLAAPCLGLALVILGTHLSTVLDVGERVEAMGRTARFAVSSSYRANTIAENRARQRDSYALDEEIVSRITGHSVEIEPYETGIAWAYPDAHWKPAPVFHGLNAYTPYLDKLNATYLASARRPEYVLRQRKVDLYHRLPRFDPPAANLAVLCHYKEAYTGQLWQLLESIPNRCGATRTLGTVTARFGDSVPVPAAKPGEAVVAHFDGVADGLGDRLRNLAYAGREIWFNTADVDGEATDYRFLPATQGDAHLLSAPLCASAELADNAEPIGSFSLSDQRGARASDETYRVRFEAVPLDC